MNKNLKSWINFFLVLIIVVVGFGLAFFLGITETKDKKEAIDKHLGNSIAIITTTGYMKGSYVIAHFYYKNKKYEFKDYPPSDRCINGLCFPVEFDTLNPNTASLVFEKPFFQDTLGIGLTQGKIIRVNESDIEFEYVVNDETYTQFQKYDPNKIMTSKNRNYSIHYRIDNPQVSIIRLE